MNTLTGNRRSEHIDQHEEAKTPINSFLFGDACVIQESQEIRAQLKMIRRTEGWIGIPHGGIGMGILMELAFRLGGTALCPPNQYPFNVEYRLGGASLRVGDAAVATVVHIEAGLSGQSCGKGKTSPI